MWTLLTIIPSIFIHLILAAGILLFLAATFLTAIPFIKQYGLLGQILGVILMSFGLFYEGGLSYKNSMEVEVANLKSRLAKAEADGAKKNTEIVEKIVKDTKIIREKGDTVIKYVENNSDRINKSCVIPSDVIDAHNRAATLDEPEDEASTKSSKMILPPRI